MELTRKYKPYLTGRDRDLIFGASLLRDNSANVLLQK